MQKAKIALIKMLGGFPDVESALRSAEGVEKRAVLASAVRHLYKSVSAEEILRPGENGGVLFEGRPMTQIEYSEIRAEAEMLRRSRLWKVLQLEVRYQLGKKMFEEARVPDDMLWGQLATFLWDVISTKIRRL